MMKRALLLLAFLTGCGSADSNVARLSTMAPSGIDDLRSWIHAQTLHPATGPDVGTFDAEVLAGHVLRGGRPHLRCGHRAELMRAIVEHRGGIARIVNIYSSEYQPGNWGHVFLEVRGERGWEAQDPDFDLEYHDATGNRLSTLEILYGDAVPCTGSTCSWDRDSDEGFPISDLKRLLHSAFVDRVFYVNPDRFDFERAQENPDIDLVAHFGGFMDTPPKAGMR